MTLKLNGSSSGSVSIDAPASTTGGADRTVTCPDATGTMALTSNICFSSYAIISDRKSSGTAGGSPTANTWTTRDLNTEIADPDSIVSISSNQFTLGAGSYLIKWRSPAHRVQEFNTALYNVTDSTYAGYGESSYTYSSDGDTAWGEGKARVTISGSKAFEIRIIINTNVGADSLGRANNMSNYTAEETYTTVEIYKEAS